MKNRVISLMLAFCLVLTLLPANVFAATASSGSIGTLLWTMDADNTLTISGSGEVPLNAWYSLDPQELVLGEGITAVQSNAFRNCELLTTVTLPKSITAIDDGAFAWCESLTTVNYSGSTTDWSSIDIGPYNKSLEDAYGTGKTFTVTYAANGGTVSQSSAFVLYGSEADLSVTAEKADLVFLGWSSDPSAILPMEYIRVTRNTTLYAVYSQPVISNVYQNITWTLDTQTGALTVSGSGAMPQINYCPPMPDVEPGDDDIDIPSPFPSIPSSYSVNLYESTTAVNDIDTSYDNSSREWYVLDTLITSLTVSEGITSISEGAFAWLDNLKTVSLPASLTDIDAYAFGTAYASLITDVIYAGSPKMWNDIDIAPYNEALTTAYRAELTVTYDANGGTTSQASVSLSYGSDADLSVTAEKAGFNFLGWHTDPTARRPLERFLPDENCTLYAVYFDPVPQSYGGITWQLSLETGELTISGSGAMPELTTPDAAWLVYADLITSVTVGEGITSLCEGAFSGCTALQSVKLPGSLTSIGSRALLSAALTEIHFNGTSVQWDEITGLENVNPTAKVHFGVASYVVYFDAWDGTVSPRTIIVAQNGTYGLLPIPLREGYTFMGWYTLPLGQGIRINDNDPVNLSETVTTFYAHWEQIIVPVPPRVSTGIARNVLKTSAILTGQMLDAGNAEILSRRFVYWEKNTPSARYTVNADANFEITVTNLVPGKTYYYFATAANAAGESNGETRSFTTLPEVRPTSVSLSKKQLTLSVNDAETLLATVLPTTAENRSVIWSSSNPAIASVDNTGRVTAHKVGSAVITVTTVVNRLASSCTVTVQAAPLVGEFDFSEWHMATDTSWYAPYGVEHDCVINGGQHIWATAYLARWGGAVLESKVPYLSSSQYNAYNSNPASFYTKADPDFHVQDVIWLPNRKNAVDNNELKAAVMNYGGVKVSYGHYDGFYKYSSAGYYLPSASKAQYSKSNHAVCVVGWDDNYSRYNFNHTPAGNGAFLCKNSWGSNWGDDGYFWISYYDAHVGYSGNTVVPSIEPADNYNTIYEYDPYGYCGSYGWAAGTSSAVYGANVFPRSGDALQQNEILQAVSFYTQWENAAYEVYVVQNYTGTLNINTRVASGTMQHMGYHTVELDRDITLQAGTRFAVIVKLTVPSGELVIFPTESPNSNLHKKAFAKSSESFLSSNGTSWIDIGDKNYNICIKAFTDRPGATDIVHAIDNLPATTFNLLSSDSSDPSIESDLANVSDFGLGYEPVMMDSPVSTADFAAGAVIPSKYSLRDAGLVTPVRNQTSYGTCWAHGMYASLESALLKQAQRLASTGETYTVETLVAAIDAAAASPAPLTVTPDEAQLICGDQLALEASVHVTWMSSNTVVATVNTDGTVSAQSPGEAVITATSQDGSTAFIHLTVSEGTFASSIDLIDSVVITDPETQFLCDYELFPTNAYDFGIVWSTSDANVATVTEDGLVELVGEGTATITARLGFNSEVFDTFIVTTDAASAPDEPSDEPVTYTITIGDSGFPFYGDDGVAVSPTLTAETNSETEQPVLLCLAVYDPNGRMIFFDEKSMQLTGRRTSYFDSMTVPVGCRIKGFLLDPISRLPLCREDEDLLTSES